MTAIADRPHTTKNLQENDNRSKILGKGAQE